MEETEMRIRATVTLRNDKMLSARENKGFSQIELADMVGLGVHIIGQLERLQFPKTYRYEDALLIAAELEIPVESVLPKEMVGWDGATKFSYTKEVPVERLLEYENTQTKHYLVDSPENIADKNDKITMIKSMLKYLSYREREVIRLRYGLDSGGMCYTLEEISRMFKATRESVRLVEYKAIRKLEKYASDPQLMSEVGSESANNGWKRPK